MKRIIVPFLRDFHAMGKDVNYERIRKQRKFENGNIIDDKRIIETKDLAESHFDENFRYDYQYGEERDFEDS